MPTYRLTTRDSVELLEADSCRVEGVHTVLRGTAYVMGLPRKVVVRRVPQHVLVKEVGDKVGAADTPSWADPG